MLKYDIQHTVSFNLPHTIYCVVQFNYRYMNGAGSNPDAKILAYAGAQVKKCMEVSKRLGAENFGKFMYLIFHYEVP